jgi:hypothetical protein
MPTEASKSEQTSSTTASPIPASSGMSTGAKAGIAVGVVIVLVGILGVGAFFLRRRRRAGSDVAPPQYSAEVYDYKSTAKLEAEKNYYYEMGNVDSRKSGNADVAELPMSAAEEAAARERARIARVNDRAAAGYDGAYRGN